MEEPGSLSSLNSMSRLSPESPKDNPSSQIQNLEKVVSSNLNSSSTSASSGVTFTEGDRLKKTARKRKGVLSLRRSQTSKRRRLRASSSNLSTRKEWALTKSSESPTTAPIPSDPGVAGVPENSQDSADRATTADLAVNREILAPKNEGSYRKEILKKSNSVVTDGVTGANLEVERKASEDQKAVHSKRAKSVGSLDTSGALDSGEQLASRNQSTPDCRILRPRRNTSNSTESSRVLRVVALSLADNTRIIGRRIKVFWPIDAQWYYGWVKEYDAALKLHLVVYDDHEQEWLPLHKERFKLQVFPGEAFGQLGSTRSASSAAQVSSDQQEEVAARESGKTARQWKGVKDGNAIGDDLLLSAVVPRGRLEGAFRKGSSNGTSKSAIPFRRTDDTFKESAFPVSSIQRDKKRTLKVLSMGGKRESYGGDQTVPSNPKTIAKVQKGARKVEASVAEKHRPWLSGGKNILSRDARSEPAAKIDDMGEVDMGKSELVYVRRHVNRSKARASLSEADVSNAQDNPVLGCSGRTKTASMAVDNRLLGAIGEESQQEQSLSNIKGPQLQTLGRTTAKPFGRPSVAPFEGQGTQLESQCGLANGNVGALGDGVCRAASTAREQKQHAVVASYSFSVHNKSPTSSDLSFQDAHLAMFNNGAALWDGKISLGYQNRKVSLSSDVKVLGNRVYPLNIATAYDFSCQCGLELQQQHYGVPTSKLNFNASHQRLQRYFHSTIHLLRLDVVVLDLFTRQLFNILNKVGFYDGGLFEERFCANGSLQDLMSIVRLLLTIIRALPLSEWVHQTWPQHWQGRILQELWNVLSGTNPWFAELPGVLPAKVEDLLVQHLRHFISEGNSVSGMTFRQMLNILVCYFIKPYVIATICERGALLTVVIQRFLLSERSNGPLQGGIGCVRQSVRSVRLRSGADADTDYSSYLESFPVSEDWCTENGLFKKQLKTWIATTAGIGYAEQLPPVPSVKRLNQQGLQVTTSHAFVREFGSGTGGNDFHLEPNGGNANTVLKSIADRLRLPGEVRDWALDGRFDFHINSCMPLDFFSGLVLTSMLQKSLLLAGGKSLSARLLTEDGIDLSSVNSHLPTGGVMSSLFKAGRKVPSYNQRINVKGCRHDAFQEDYAVGMEVEARPGGFMPDLSTDSMTGGKVPAKRIKIVADSSMSVRSTFSTLEYNSSGSVKHEGCLEINMLETREDGSLIVQDTGKDTPQCELAKYSYFPSGSPANLSFESTLGPTSMEASGPDFRSQSNGNRFFGQRGKEPWRDPKMASYYNRVLDRRKRKQGIPRLVSPAYNDVSHLRGKRHGKRGRPSRQSRQDKVADQTSLYCSANLLITKGDRGWRESDVRVELRPNSSECLIAVQGAGDKLYTHKVQQSMLTGITNRYTQARVWKGGNGWSLEFGDRKQWNLFKGLYEECVHQNARAASVKQIPIPGVRQVEDFDLIDLGATRFVRSNLGYIYQADTEGEAALKSTCVLYDMDSEDEAWLTEINGICDEHRSSKLRITEDCLEGIVDKLEKATYVKPDKLVSPDDAVEICQGWGHPDAVRVVYVHWCKKRLSKGTALARQFQPPLWEQYEKQLQKWQASLSELQMHLPSASKEQLLEHCPRPLMFAFCLRPRGLVTNNMNKKIQKQRSQRKFSSVVRTVLLAETSEESQRASTFWPQQRQAHHHSANSSIDPDWRPSSRASLFMPSRYIKPVGQRNALQDEYHERLVSGLHRQTAGLDPFTKAEEAQARAAAARERAAITAGKSHRLFLKFDSALHRAIAALIEFEAIHFAELALADQETEVCSPPVPNEQLSNLNERVGHLSCQLLNLSEKSDDSGSAIKDESSGSLLDLRPIHCDDGNNICRGYTQTEEFEGADTKHSFMEYADALLPMPAWGHLDAWMGTTLLQKTDEGNTSQHIS